jgi:hypothetical protein
MYGKFFEQLRKVKIIFKTAMVCKKIKNACSINDTVGKSFSTKQVLPSCSSSHIAFRPRHNLPAPCGPYESFCYLDKEVGAE